jgi:integrase
MGIYRRENGYYYAYCPWRTKKALPPRISLGTKNKARAKLIYEQLEREERFEGAIGGRSQKLQEFVNYYLEECCQPPKKTLKNYRLEKTRLKHISEFLQSQGCSLLSHITIRHAEKLINHLTSEGKSPKTVNHYIGHLKTALNVAIQWGYLRDNPLRNLKPLKVMNVRAVRAFTIDEIKKLLSVADEEASAYIKLLFYTGLRLSEMANLRFSDIDFDRRVLTVQASGEFSPKSRRIRHIPLSIEAVEFLKSLPRNGEYVFSSPNGSKRYKRPNNYTREIRKVIEAAGLYEPGIGPHAIRHTYISLLCSAGAAPTVVQELAGHSDIHTTMKYVHQFPASGRAEVERLSLK